MRKCINGLAIDFYLLCGDHLVPIYHWVEESQQPLFEDREGYTNSLKSVSEFTENTALNV